MEVILTAEVMLTLTVGLSSPILFLIGGMLQRTINLYISSFAITRVRVTHTKDARIRKLGNLTVLIVRGHVLCLIKGVLNAKTRHLGSMW